MTGGKIDWEKKMVPFFQSNDVFYAAMG